MAESTPPAFELSLVPAYWAHRDRVTVTLTEGLPCTCLQVLGRAPQKRSDHDERERRRHNRDGQECLLVTGSFVIEPMDPRSDKIPEIRSGRLSLVKLFASLLKKIEDIRVFFMLSQV